MRDDPQKMVGYNGKSENNMDDLGVPPFQETSMYINHQKNDG